jgi:predicted DNA-binding transcriptional regulator AlpA
MIRCWPALEKYMGYHRNTVERWIKLYGFPAGVREGHTRRDCLTWQKSEVNAWVKANTHILNKLRDRYKMQSMLS